jgi:hypothetical protein
VGDTGLEPLTKSTGKSPTSQSSGAESGALVAGEAQSEPRLSAVVEAWPMLPEAIKAGILAMIRAAIGSAG